MFNNRSLLIATKHGKQQVMAPLLEKQLGVTCIVKDHLDTDVLGTFTGEIERKDDPVTTLRKKCLLAMETFHVDVAVASEGSFGPHPSLFFLNADDELVMLLDKKNNLEIIAREVSTETNFNGSEMRSEEELIVFAKQAMFPSHGLILRNKKEGFTKICKGITDWETLLVEYREMYKQNNSVYVETDMRALYNPSRMKVIEKATLNLIDKIKSLCPKCENPGFSVTEIKSGLPCSQCQMPTRSALSHIYQCAKCHYISERKYPYEKAFEEPTFCDVCNP